MSAFLDWRSADCLSDEVKGRTEHLPGRACCRSAWEVEALLKKVRNSEGDAWAMMRSECLFVVWVKRLFVHGSRSIITVYLTKDLTEEPFRGHQ